MGIIIKSVGSSLDRSNYSSIAHASIAGTDCLRKAQVHPENVSFLFNTGIYRDLNMAEPAMAALIQKELRMNVDYLASKSLKSTVSFDLMNGPCGFLNAVQAASAFLIFEPEKLALIVSSDVHPSQTEKEQSTFPYANVGSALLLENVSNPQKGFGPIEFKTSTEADVGLEGFTQAYRPESRYSVTIQEHSEYSSRLTSFLAESITQYVEREKIDLNETLIISTQTVLRDTDAFAKKINAPRHSLFHIRGIEGDLYTSTLALGFEQAMESQMTTGRYKQILFAIAGSGITSACAIYRP